MLIPALIGYEGKRVEVTYAEGDKERFIVTRTKTEPQIHMMLKRRQGIPILRKIINVRPLKGAL